MIGHEFRCLESVSKSREGEVVSGGEIRAFKRGVFRLRASKRTSNNQDDLVIMLSLCLVYATW